MILRIVKMNIDTFKLETILKDLNPGKHFAAAKEALESLKEKIE